MNKILRFIGHRQTQKPQPTQSSGSRLGASTRLAGVVFALLTANSQQLSLDLPLCVKLALELQGRVFGMLGGLMQFLFEGQSEAELRESCATLAKKMNSALEGRVIIVFIVQPCQIGCWGNSDYMNYGVLVPSIQQVMGVLAAAKPGETLSI